MAKTYKPTPAEVSAGFPATIYSPTDRLDPKIGGHGSITEPFTVPASADSEGKYRVLLKYVPLDTPTFSCTVNALSKAPVRYGSTVASSEVGISWELPVLEFAAALAGLAGSTTYDRWGSTLPAPDLTLIEKELAAVQEYARNGRPPILFDLASAPETSSALPPTRSFYLPQSDLVYNVAGIWVFAGDTGFVSGVSTFKVTTETSTGTFSENVNGVTTADLTNSSAETDYRTFASKSWAIDASGGALWLNLFCTAAGGHQEIKIGLVLQ